MYRSITFIINPASGSGKTKKKLKGLVREIRSVAKHAAVVLTGHPLHAIGLTKDALNKGAERLVVVGGDGTLNEVVNGYFDAQGKPLNKNASIAVVPSGTGSDFYRNISAKTDIKSAIYLAVNGIAQPTDVGFIEAHDANGLKVTRYFINVSSLGLSGLVAGFMKTVTKRFGSTSAYFIATVQAIRTFLPPTLRLFDNGEVKTLKNCAIISFANGKFFGSGMKIAPNAKLDDGLLDVIAVTNLSPLLFFLNSYRLYQGTHLALDNVQEFHEDSCSVESLTNDPVYIETDGELFAQLPAKFSVMRGAINIVR